MPRIEHNVTISLDLWNRIKRALDMASDCDHDDIPPLLDEIRSIENGEDEDDIEEEEEDEEDEEDRVEPIHSRITRRRANARPVSGEPFFDVKKRKRGRVTVIPNPPGVKGLDKYHESVTDKIHDRLLWSDEHEAWTVKPKVISKLRG